MPFPREFPREAAAALGRAVLTKDFDQAYEPAYDVAGYGAYQLGLAADDDARPYPRASVHLAREAALTDEDVAQLLIEASEETPLVGATYGEEPEAVKAIPWSIVLPLAFKVIQKAIERFKNK